MDGIGWFIATLHGLLGHDKTAAFLGQPAGNPDDCLICQYEGAPSEPARQAVIQALARPGVEA